MKRFFASLWQATLISILGYSLTVGQALMIGTVTAAIVPASACNAAAIVSDIQKFLPVVVDILSVVAAETGNSTAALQTKITTEGNDAIQLANDYLAQKSTGIWNDMNAAFTVFEQDSQLVFQMANVGSAGQAKIDLMVMAAQTLLAVIETLIPAPPAGATAQVSRRFAKSLPAGNWTLGDCTAAWNKAVTAKSPDPKLDSLTKHMQVHVHNWVVRHVILKPGQ